MHVDTDFTPYPARGGKLLFYIGWNDFHNSTDLTACFKAVVAKAGTAQAQANTRLFTIQGMGHCQGGRTCDTFSKLGVIDAWVAQGHAHSRIIATKFEGASWFALARSAPIRRWPATRARATSRARAALPVAPVDVAPIGRPAAAQVDRSPFMAPSPSQTVRAVCDRGNVSTCVVFSRQPSPRWQR